MAGNWTQEEKTELTKVFIFLEKIQKTYGREIQMRETLQAWEFLLSPMYSVGEIIEALKIYILKKNDIPAPSDIVAILSPERPKISHAEFIHANEQWAKENYSPYSPNAQIVREYRNQESDNRDKPFEIAESIKEIAKVVVSKPPEQIEPPVKNEQRQPNQQEMTYDFQGKWSDWDVDTKIAFIHKHKSMTQDFYKFLEPIYGLTWDELQEQIKAIG